MKGKWCAVVFLCAFFVILGCSKKDAAGGQQGAHGSSSKKTTINFWTWRPEDVEVYDKLLAIFEKENPDIHVVQTPYKNTEYNAVLSTALAGKSGPDVFQCRAYGGLETFAVSGFLEPLDDLVPELAAFAEAPRMGASSISDGKIYGVPFASQTLFVYYNTAIYQKLGLKAPVTWDEFKANCEAVKTAGLTPIAHGGKDGWILGILMGTITPNFYGANTFYNKVTRGETNFQDPAFVAAIDRLNELVPYMPDKFMSVSYDQTRALFLDEQAAHFIGGSYEAGYFSGQKPSLNYDIFAPPVAQAGDTSYVSVYADGNFSMNSASANKDAAVKLLRFFASKTAGNAFIKDLKQVSSVPGVDTSSDPFIAKVISLQKNNTPYIFFVGFGYNQPSGSTLAQAGLQEMFRGSLNAAGVCKQIQDGIAEYYKPFQK